MSAQAEAISATQQGNSEILNLIRGQAYHVRAVVY
jgi:hypothetical protein